MVTSINSVVISRGTDIYLEQASNKVTSITSSSTDTQYPSAKAVYSLQPEYIILEGDISWLSGSTHQFEDADEIASLNHFKDLALAGKHPRFGFTQTMQGTTSMVAREPDNYMTYSGSDGFTALFLVYFGPSFGSYGITLDYSNDIWTLTAEQLTSA